MTFTIQNFFPRLNFISCSILPCCHASFTSSQLRWVARFELSVLDPHSLDDWMPMKPSRVAVHRTGDKIDLGKKLEDGMVIFSYWIFIECSSAQMAIRFSYFPVLTLSPFRSSGRRRSNVLLLCSLHFAMPMRPWVQVTTVTCSISTSQCI